MDDLLGKLLRERPQQLAQLNQPPLDSERCLVVLHGLECDPSLNGKVGVTDGMIKGTDGEVMLKVKIMERYVVMKDDGYKLVTVKPENLLRITLHESFKLLGYPHRVCGPVGDGEGNSIPSHYGGGELKPDLHYAFLPRSGAPLPAIFQTVQAPTPVVAEALRKLCEGRFVYGWCISSPSASEDFVGIYVGLDDRDGDLALPSNLPVLIIGSTRTADPSDGSGTPASFETCTRWNGAIGNMLSFDERDTLQRRIFHYILRQHGATDPRLLELAVRITHDFYWPEVLRTERCMEAFDLGVALYDAYTSLNDSSNGSQELEFLAMRASTRLHDPDLYIALLKTQVDRTEINSLEARRGVVHLCLRIADVSMNTGRLEDALSWTFKALRLVEPDSLDPVSTVVCDSDQMNNALAPFATNALVTLRKAFQMQSRQQQLDEESDKINLALTGLLFTADLTGHEVYSQDLDRFLPEVAKNALKQKFWARNKALRKLNEILLVNTFEQLKGDLRKCVHALTATRAIASVPQLPLVTFDAEHVKSYLSKAYPPFEDYERAIRFKCQGCGKEWSPPDEGSFCSCETVAYCNKECQVKHWKEHKKVCRYFKRREEEKRAAQNSG